jgi:hypothetical protein
MVFRETTVAERVLLTRSLTELLQQLPVHHAFACALGAAILIARAHGFTKETFLRAVDQSWED